MPEGMGLRLVAHFYERNEAFIAASALDAAGVVVFVEGQAQNSIAPLEEIARGGYRLMAPEEEIASAVAVLNEARGMRSFEGERLSQRTYIVLSFVLLAIIGIFMPFRTSKWHDA